MTLNTEDQTRRYLIVNADDLGSSKSVNAAIAEAYDRGIVTSASLMAGGEAFDEAVQETMKRNLSLGLHVTLCDGRSVLKHGQIPDLVDSDGCFEESPVKAWIKYMKPGILPQIEAEVAAQFDRLEREGLKPDHVNSHHHLQMHPLIFEIICRQASKRGVSWVRIPNEPVSVVFSRHSLARGIMPFVEKAVFGMLRSFNLKTARKYRMNVASYSLGLAWTGSIDEKLLSELLSCAKGRVNEIFLHPDTQTGYGRKELEALASDSVLNRISSAGMETTGFSELAGKGTASGSHLKRLSSEGFELKKKRIYNF